MTRRTSVLLAAALAAACSSRSAPFVIGISGPFSQDRGVSMLRAAELAAREINERGGIAGRPLRLKVLDDSADNNVAVRAAQQMVDDRAVLAVIGHLTSGQTLATAPVYNDPEHPVLEISPSASSPDLSTAGDYTFRVCPSDNSHGRQLARWARERLAARRVAVIYLNSDYGRGIRAEFITEFQKLGGTVISQDPYLADPTPFEPYLSRMRRTRPDALMIAGERPGAVQILEEMNRQGWRVPVIGGDALTGIDQSPRAEGVEFSTAYLPDRPGPRNQTFVEAYARAYDGARPDHRGAGAYDIVYLLAQGLADGARSRQALRDWLAGVGTARPAYEGVTGSIAFDQYGDVPTKSVVIGVVRDRRLVAAEGEGQ